MPTIKNNIEYFSVKETELYLENQANKRAKIFAASVLEKQRSKFTYV